MSIRIKGAEKLRKQLERLEKSDARKALNKGKREAGKAMARVIKPAAPVDEGVLKKAETYKLIGRGDRGGVIAGADMRKLQPDESRPTNVDHLVEFGHVGPGGTFVPPHPFMRPNAAEALRAGEAAYVAGLKAGIEAAI